MEARRRKKFSINPPPPPPPPFILMISLRHQTLFDHAYASFLEELTAKANLERLDDPAFVLMRLTPVFTQPQAVIIADEALTLRRYRNVLDSVRQYLHRGGNVIVMGHFPAFVKPAAVGKFFSALGGLPWEAAWYGRKRLLINRACADPFGVTDLLDEYDSSALYLRNVRIINSCYIVDPNSAHDPDGPQMESSSGVPLTSVAWAKVGDGKLGYVGDVRMNNGSRAVLAVMCGIGDPHVREALKACDI